MFKGKRVVMVVNGLGHRITTQGWLFQGCYSGLTRPDKQRIPELFSTTFPTQASTDTQITLEKVLSLHSRLIIWITPESGKNLITHQEQYV